MISSLGFLLGSSISQAQDPVFRAVVSSNQVVQNTVFEIQFELRNARGDNFQPPTFENFKVVGGPATSSQTMIVNGEVSRSQSWSYSLLAVKEGNHTIGPATIAAGRKVLTTRPVIIDVLEAKSASSTGQVTTGQEKVILLADLDTTTYYPGQQIILRYKLLFNENIQSVTTLNEDDYSDFFIQNFSSFSHQSSMENLNGATYTGRVIKGLALFAHQSGAFTIDPMILDVAVEAPFPEKRGFFTMRSLESIKVASSPKTINIIPLPSGAPTSFSGAVGQYSVTGRPGLTEITTDDAFTMRLEIKGNGDSRRWDPPSPVVDGDFEIYEPRIVDDKMVDESEHITHLRTIEYQIIPRQPGQYKVVIPLTYFDPLTRKYETVSSDTIRLHVTQGSNLSGRPQIKEETEVPGELRKIRNITTDDRFWLSIPHLFLFGLIVSGSFWGAWVSFKRRRENLIPEEVKIRSAATRHARKQLDELHSASDTISSKEFFERATEIYYKFLSDKLNIPPANLDLDKFPFYLEKENIAGETKERIIRFFDQCLSVRYGGIPGGRTKEEMLAEIRTIIDLLEI